MDVIPRPGVQQSGTREKVKRSYHPLRIDSKLPAAVLASARPGAYTVIWGWEPPKSYSYVRFVVIQQTKLKHQCRRLKTDRYDPGVYRQLSTLGQPLVVGGWNAMYRVGGHGERCERCPCADVVPLPPLILRFRTPVSLLWAGCAHTPHTERLVSFHRDPAQ